MTWTTQKPSKPGWYWYRESPKHAAHMTCVRKGFSAYVMRFFLSDSHVDHSVTTLNGEWSSEPIAEPEEEASIHA